MGTEDLDQFEAERQLALYEEYKSVSDMFTFVVESDRRFYLANQVQVEPKAVGEALYFEVTMSDVWVWDVFRTNRFVKSVTIYATKDVNVEERQKSHELTFDEVMGFDTPNR